MTTAPATSRRIALPDGTALEVRTSGAGEVPVVLLAGGTAPSIGFFPGLTGLRNAVLIEHDRVGTGSTPARDVGPPSLASAAADLHALRQALALPPVVVLAQSFGGPAAIQWATDFPDDVAGLVLVDPTPIDARQGRAIAIGARLIGACDRPVLRGGLNRLARRSISRHLAPGSEVEAATEVLLGEQWRRLALTVKGYPAQAADLAARLAPRAERVVEVVGADRKPGHKVRLLHEQMTAALGGTYQVWDGAVHAMHLQLPDRLRDLVQSVVDSVASRASQQSAN